MKKLGLYLAFGVSMLALSILPAAAYDSVSDARLANPEPQNWLQYRGNYAGWGYSPLAKINDKNVSKLNVAWVYSTGQLEGHQSPPIVNNGVMFVTSPGNLVIALDAKTGSELWRYQHQVPDELMQLHPTNRGVALYGDKVYFGTTDAKLIALDAVTGKEAWQVPVADWKSGYYITLAPLAAEGKILVGSSGGELGVRGFVAAFDATTGKEAWRTFTIPAPGEPGGDSWPADSYQRGGGSTWISGSYDPKTHVTYWGTGNAAPWMPDTRPGDNLYANSVIALDIDTGKLKGFHQYHQADAWDWDEVSTPMLIDYQHEGKTISGLVHAGRDGYLWLLERKPDSIGYVKSWPFVRQDVFTSVDPKSGRPTYDPSKTPGTGKTVHFCPSLWGGKDWFPEAYNPQTKLLYVPANNNLCSELTGEKVSYKAGKLYIGVALSNILTNVRMDDKALEHVGEVQAWDLSTGKQVWTHKYKEMNWGPLLTTGGDLVFGGGTNDRKFHAFNAKTGDMLWEFPTNSGVTGVPSTFEVDGEQYIAVQSGWGVDAQRMQGAFDAVLPHKTVVPQGGAIWVFKLPKQG